MFFQDHEKTIYSPPGVDRSYDPLALDRALTRASQGRLNDMLMDWRSKEGDATVSGVLSAPDARLLAAVAEENLVQVARAAFDLPAFPECLDGVALECLCDFLGWMEKKGRRGETPPSSPSPSGANGSIATTSSSSYT